jgi:hypothetical protein
MAVCVTPSLSIQTCAIREVKCSIDHELRWSIGESTLKENACERGKNTEREPF